MVILSSKFNPSAYMFFHLQIKSYKTEMKRWKFTLVNSAKYTLTILHLTALIQELDWETYFETEYNSNYFQFFTIIKVKKRKEKNTLKPKVKYISETGSELNNLQDVNSQSFDCHNQPISKPAIIW
ncbi:hypothetical protein Avbf_18069 [Armadillidium vulgare]|nr:hypothetical protein Avbf_18069 [Armadillidium vulgare]